MKGDITKIILEKISEIACGVADLSSAIISAGYGASARKINREFEKRQNERGLQINEKEIKHKLYIMTRHLENDGLIEKIKDDKYISYRITKKGLKKLKKLKNRVILPSFHYSKPTNENVELIIVIFDIPEREKRKRCWLRSALTNLGLQIIQRSVWFGKTKIPEQFIKDIGKMKIQEYIEIFSINKSGTLKNIVKNPQL
ncbi:MAG TPA: CRISPR-associated endonuclease Cas2 [Candidatus Paceibacterota bacterium]|nr:CRISPR-associated endonuclease Cas2 [Candidatus Paceibacterota bacterium]